MPLEAAVDVKAEMEALVVEAQRTICDAVASMEGGRFREDRWQRPGGGGGITRILQDGRVFEKAGVNVSVVSGRLPAKAAAAMGGGAGTDPEALDFFAAGLSVVIHPRNPMAPTAHCNYRYFERGLAGRRAAWWFGGGSDLTPSYLFDEDAVHFHRTLKAVCDRHDDAFYPRFKRWCDEYFRLPHRGECRGVGGIFFDDLRDRQEERLLHFVRDCAHAFVPSYLPLVERRMSSPYTPENKRWQGLRRGRYVEFNLLYDRGTTFGLQTGGRTESILMSLPLSARWEYEAAPEEGSEEARIVDVLKHPKTWV